jgi:tyrosyl-tRNA synthetase
MIESTQQIELIKRGCVEIISEPELKAKLDRKKPLRIKLGVDPTSPDLHLGHLVLLNKLLTFQKLGHHVLFLIGDFTARIGDPSGRLETRPVLSEDQIKANCRTYQEQVLRVLDKDKTEFVYNSTWLAPLGANGLLDLSRKYTVARLLERDDFSKRYKSGSPITLLEFFYPLLQGYDSVAMKADIELGGNDQKFNLLVGREFQRDAGQESQVVITLPLLEGLDGTRKMSKSYGNHIAFNDSPKDMFGKTMSVPDELMWKYYELLTDEDVKTVKALHPKEAKMRLAGQITGRFHGKEVAAEAQKKFEQVFSQKSVPEDIEEFICSKKSVDPIDLLVESKLAPSRNEARRLVQQGGVEADGQRVALGAPLEVAKPFILKVGKRRFKKILPPK